MICLDSSIWIEYFLNREKKLQAEKLINQLGEQMGIISTFSLLEIKYTLTRIEGLGYARKVIEIINSFPNLAILPLNEEVADFASEIKTKYYSKENRFSYGDSIILATALLLNCEKLYTKDEDFAKVTEVKPVII